MDGSDTVRYDTMYDSTIYSKLQNSYVCCGLLTSSDYI